MSIPTLHRRRALLLFGPLAIAAMSCAPGTSGSPPNGPGASAVRAAAQERVALRTCGTPRLGLLEAELANLRDAEKDTRLGRLRELVLREADRRLDPLDIEPKRLLSDEEKSPKHVKAKEAMTFGFLADYNAHLDALGLAFALTGEQGYADRLAAHLAAWEKYSPPTKRGGLEGGEPSIYHRNFFGLFRGVDMAWDGLDRDAKRHAVDLAETVQETMTEWWERTDWPRNNHAAATNQTGLYAAVIELRGAAEQPALYAERKANAWIEAFVEEDGDVERLEALGGGRNKAGQVGFATQVRFGVNSPENAETYAGLNKLAKDLPGGSLDYFFKPEKTRFTYHGLLLHHTLTTWWALERNGIEVPDRELLRENIGLLIEFTRPYLERGKRLPGSSEKPPAADKYFLSRELIAMAQVLFPEKEWLDGLLERSKPLSVGEAYFAAALY